MSCRRPTERSASCWNALGERSTLPTAQLGQVSATMTVTDLPAAVTCIWRPHIGFLSGEIPSECVRTGNGGEAYALGFAVAPGKD